MSYEFLAAYHIPTLQQGAETPALSIPPLAEEAQQQNQQAVDNINQYQNINRYIPPGLQGTNFVPPLALKPQKRKYDAGPGSSKDTLVETTADGQLVIFQGRDATYPEELNKLIHPLHCSLCEVQMNSSKSAKDHYESKQHDRHITQWINKNYVEKGLTAPTVKRFIKNGPLGPDSSLHCEICDLKFGSLAHASQHYSGRKHKLVASKISQPSGSGYYNVENKWVRTGTKFVQQNDNDGRFGIGELFKLQTDDVALNETTPDTTTPSAVADIAVANLDGAGETAGKVVPTPLYCDICKVHVTSEGQMSMHLQGIKHKKKVKTLSLEASITQEVTVPNITIANKSEDTILESLKRSNPGSDLSMYRTPSGSYYCESCNISMCHVAALQQHLTGRKHIKKVSEVKEKAKNEAKCKIESKV